MRKISQQFVLGLTFIYGCLQLSLVKGDDERIAAIVNKAVDECTKETGINKEQTNLIMADAFELLGEDHFSHEMKCFLLCFHRSVGVIDADGGPIEKPFMNFMEIRFSQKKDKIMPALVKCRKVVEADPCEHVFKFEMCMAHTIEGDKWDV
ncbi:uncharacterized protein LOC106088808 [Stomoxys calcitrans]|uniref:uncharacterized protein LOC106088808 n=1 Tax=Stomoxys calcitrans TaxID=35570 RepID=UPI0027E35D6A|nr:uncharacterized protein LOC106088808 [Stomoxys calcitrans]